MSTLGCSQHNGHIRAEFIPGVSVKGTQDLFPRLSCKACWNAIRCHINWCLSPQCGLHVRITRDENKNSICFNKEDEGRGGIGKKMACKMAVWHDMLTVSLRNQYC